MDMVKLTLLLCFGSILLACARGAADFGATDEDEWSETPLQAQQRPPVQLASSSSPDSCNELYSRCRQTSEMQIASGATSDHLNPNDASFDLPFVLSTPNSILSPIMLSKDPSTLTAKAARSTASYMGNYEYCNYYKTDQSSHYCVLSSLGPKYGLCLPESCSASEYKKLAVNCAGQRLARNVDSTRQLLNHTFVLQAQIDSIADAAIKELHLDTTVHEIERALAALLAAGLNLPGNGSDSNIEQLISVLHNQTLYDQLDAALGAAQAGFNYFQLVEASEADFCTDADAQIGTSAVFLVAFSCAMGILCLLATAYEMLLLPQLVERAPGFASKESQQLRTPDMKWLMILHPEHEAFVKENNFYPGGYQLAKMFSVYSNTMELLTQRTKGDFKSLNGIRVLSTGYIVLGHAIVFLGLTANNVNAIPGLKDFATSFNAVIISGAFLSVDTFFFISGFLGAYVMIRSIEKIKSFGQFVAAYPLILTHRYLRLTPVYAYVLWFYIAGSPLLLSGYQAHNPAAVVENSFCSDYWWHNLLYINNVAPWGTDPTGTCMGWSWYLANDWMFYCMLPFVVYIYAKSPKWYIGVLPIVAFCIGNIVTNGVLNSRHEINSFFSFNADYSKYLYGHPWTRWAPYFIGAGFGLFFHEKKKGKPKYLDASPPEPLSCGMLSMYWLSGILMALVAFILPWYAFKDSAMGVLGPSTWSQGVVTAFNALQRPLFAVGLAGICHMFFTGHGSVTKRFLEHPVWDILAKLSYGTYLWAIMIQNIYNQSLITPVAFENDRLTWLNFGCTALGFIVSYISYVVIERPMGVLVTMLLPSKPKPDAPPKSKPDALKDGQGDVEESRQPLAAQENEDEQAV